MNTYYIAGFPVSDELYHHGILGQKWGVRRYQNEDGSLTPEGLKRYGKASTIQRDLNRMDKEFAYSKGDIMKLMNKGLKTDSKLQKYMQKNPNDEKGKAQKYRDEINDYTAQIEGIGQRMNNINKMKEGLMWKALGNGMSISVKDVPRDTVRSGERWARGFGAALMAVSMAYVSPIGFGIGYGGSTTGYTQGHKYKIRNNPYGIQSIEGLEIVSPSENKRRT